MGLKMSPRFFQSVMHKIFAELLNDTLESYQDDILLKAKSFDGAYDALRKTLLCIRKHGLKLKLEKCKFMYTEVKYLGFLVTPETLIPPPDKLESIRMVLPPNCIKELQSFLGLANQYRSFISNYSQLAGPLYKLQSPKHHVSKKFVENWLTPHQEAFDALKDALTTDGVVLHHPDFNRQFTIRCDASKTHVGAVLEQEGRLVSCCSKSLKGYQENWHILVKEFYAIVYACQKFHFYIDGRSSIRVFTDHKALEYMLEGKLSDKLYRWVLTLLQYDLEVKYISGEDNAAADALTRLRFKIRLPDDVPSTLAHIHSIVGTQTHKVTSEKHWLNSMKNEDEEIVLNNRTNMYEICSIQSKTDITRKYKEELGINREIDLFTLDEAHPNYFSAQMAVMDSHLVKTDPRIRETTTITDMSTKLRYMRSAHNLAHLSPGKMSATIRQYVNWRGMDADILNYVSQCHVCSLWSKTTGESPYPTISEPNATIRFDTVQMDIIHFDVVLDRHNLEYSHALSLIDMATGYR